MRLCPHPYTDWIPLPKYYAMKQKKLPLHYLIMTILLTSTTSLVYPYHWASNSFKILNTLYTILPTLLTFFMKLFFHHDVDKALFEFIHYQNHSLWLIIVTFLHSIHVAQLPLIEREARRWSCKKICDSLSDIVRDFSHFFINVIVLYLFLGIFCTMVQINNNIKFSFMFLNFVVGCYG